MLNHTGANESSKRGKKSKNQKNLFYFEGSELFLQHIIGDCLLNYDTRKKINKTYKIYHRSSVLSLGFEFGESCTSMTKSCTCVCHYMMLSFSQNIAAEWCAAQTHSETKLLAAVTSQWYQYLYWDSLSL